LKVAILTRGAHPFHGPGGLERAVYSLARHLQKHGVETILLTRPPEHTTGKTVDAFPGEVISVPYRWLPLGAHGRVLDRIVNYPRFAQRLGSVAAGLVRDGRVDIVHAHGIAGLGYARERISDPAVRAPLITNPHGMEEHATTGLKRLALTSLRAQSREAARRSDRVIATDLALRESVSSRLGVEAARIVVLPNGIDPEQLESATPRAARAFADAALPELTDAQPVLLSVGRLEGYKGFLDIQTALESLAQVGQLSRNWAWVVVGDGPLAATLRKRAARSGLTQHIHIIGRAEEPLLRALHERADVFVHAPHFEGSSLVTLEAMVHGLPIVATDVGGIPDKITDGESGRLVPAQNARALGSAIMDMCGDPQRAQQLGATARARVLAEFAWPAIAARTAHLYAALLGEGA